ncbi:BlaI/MecI/CopY family transcriptional regulator [Kitasatospora sp. NPDC056327]|uniref:BlaI/MecI/CopY family transcriptional regulator n=1 Tax=Kitasatospora sp. NPDC056327 TaxID=3345785 RepID=UPI0035D7D5A8
MTGSEDDKLRKALGPLGAELLTVLWGADGPLSVRQVLEEVNRRRGEPLAYTTVMTVLNRLSERNVVRRAARGRGFVYTALVTGAADLAVRDVILDHGLSVVAHFVDRYQAEPQLRARLMNLIRPENEDS